MNRIDRIARRARPGAIALVLWLMTLIGLSPIGAALATEKKDGDKLSNAAKETAKPSDEQRTLHAESKRDCNHGSVLDVFVFGSGGGSGGGSSGESRGDQPTLPEHDFLRRLHVGAVVETGAPASPDFASSTLYGLKVGISDRRRTSLDLMVLGGPARFAPGSDIAARFRAPAEFALDGSVRYSITPPSDAFGLAPLVGFRVGWLGWDYLNGIWLEQDGGERQVRDDGIDHYSPYVGLAATFLHTRHVDLAVTGIVGWRYYGSHTDDGLRNDLFGQGRFSEVRLETRFGL